ncbi:MAG: nitroreductase family protein [Lachnospirales bacterium]
MEEVLYTLKNHTSIRKFNDEQITKKEEEEIIACALRGATAGGMMLYSIIKIRDKNNLKYLSEKCDNQSFIEKSDLGLIFLADAHKYYQYFEIKNVKNYDGNGPKSSDLFLSIADTMIAAQNSVIAAESLNIGTCYIGDILENIEEIQKYFNLPSHVIPFTMVVFGKYSTKPKLRNRFDEKFVVFDEKYPYIDADFINKMFYSEETNNDNNANEFYNRKINSDFTKEMRRSCNKYIKEWL